MGFFRSCIHLVSMRYHPPPTVIPGLKPIIFWGNIQKVLGPSKSLPWNTSAGCMQYMKFSRCHSFDPGPSHSHEVSSFFFDLFDIPAGLYGGVREWHDIVYWRNSVCGLSWWVSSLAAGKYALSHLTYAGCNLNEVNTDSVADGQCLRRLTVPTGSQAMTNLKLCVH